MKIPNNIAQKLERDLALNTRFARGPVQIDNCWHFSTDGRNVDAMFFDDQDFKAGMNRIYLLSNIYQVVILAFSLMDTHIHFVLYGDYDECNRFIHDYVKRTSMHIAQRHNLKGVMDGVPVSHQKVDTDEYLKTVICYINKNAPVGGIAFNAFDYPWSSAPLYFRPKGVWSAPEWAGKELVRMDDVLGKCGKRKFLNTWSYNIGNPEVVGDIVFPGEYVAYETVERIFRTHKSYNYFMCRSREDDVDKRGGLISTLSIPRQEMRQNRDAAMKALFGTDSLRMLSTEDRLRLARHLKSRYNSSAKQIALICGLVFDEVKEFL